MAKLNAYLKRENYGEIETLGTLTLKDENDRQVFECKTLEMPWKDNEVRESCIPEGSYSVRYRKAEESGSFGYDHFLIEDVRNRSYILFHAGNYYTDIAGCILVGRYFKDINSDGTKDVVKSRSTLKDMLNKVRTHGENGRFHLCISS